MDLAGANYGRGLWPFLIDFSGKITSFILQILSKNVAKVSGIVTFFSGSNMSQDIHLIHILITGLL